MKQGAHNWYAELKRVFLKYNYSVSCADEAVFFKLNGDKYTIVATATDDFTIIGDSTESTNSIKRQLSNHFEIVDMGTINWLLSISITHDLEAKTISLGQQAYINQIIAHFRLQDAHVAVTPMEPGIDLTPDSLSVLPNLLNPSEKTKYCEMIGSLMYVSVMTCPDISFAVSTLSQFLLAPRMTHLHTVT